MPDDKIVQRLLQLKAGKAPIRPMQVSVPDDVLHDLQVRLGQARWPDQLQGQDWRLGTELGCLQRICEYWKEHFNWRAAEARINALPQFQVTVDGFALHVVHARSDAANAIPLLLVNGWPSSIFEYLDIIPRLTAAGFHVVAPALPGYGFSDRPDQFGVNGTRIAELFAAMMGELGYESFVAHGSDMGGAVVEAMRRNHPGRLLGAHFSNLYWGYPRPEDPTPEEQAYLGRAQGWQFAEGAYLMLQGTKPQTLSYALNDSPAGLAAWILEKFRAWSGSDMEKAYGLDGLCANLTLYWATQTIGSSMRLYAEMFADQPMQGPPPRVDVPVGVTIFPGDYLQPPRAWGERWLNIVQWSEAPRGGHFGAWDEPELLVQDLQAFANLIGGTPR